MKQKVYFRWALSMMICCMAFTSQAANVKIRGLSSTQQYSGYPLYWVGSDTIKVSSSEGSFNYIYMDGLEVAYNNNSNRDVWYSYSLNITSYFDEKPHKLQLKNGSYDCGICYIQFSEDHIVDGLIYSIDDTSAAVVGCSTSDESAVVLDEYELNGVKYSVTKIADQVFSECTALQNVTIPNSVTTIGDSAFIGCSGLTSVTIPNSVTTIGNFAFSGCSGLTTVTIPNSVTSIGSYAFSGCTGLISAEMPNTPTCGIFWNCSGLTSVTIPSFVTSIPYGTFYGCSSLTSITIPNSVTSIDTYAFKGCKSLNSLTFENGDATLSLGCNDDYPTRGLFYDCPLKSLYLGRNLSYMSGSSYGYSPFAYTDLQSITIGDSVTSIGSYAFSRCRDLTSVTIPNSVSSIGSSAFENCYSLEKAEFASIESLCNITFAGYDSNPLYYAKHLYINGEEITNLVIPDSVTSIGSYAFYNCSGLTSVTIPNSVTSIGYGAFDGCSGLTSVTIPNSVTSIGNYAFSGCSGLTTVTIPNSVTSIGSYAFHGCSGLKSVNFNAENCTYSGSSSGPCFPSYITEFRIGNDVKAIPSYLLYDCSGLTSVTIPNSVTSIGNYSFDRCDNLHSLKLGSGLLSIGSWSSSSSNVHYPEKVVWLANTPPSGYNNIRAKVNYIANNNYSFSSGTTYVYNNLNSMFEADGIVYVPVNPAERTCDIIDCPYSDAAKDIALNPTTSYRGIQMSVKNIRPYSFYGNKHIENLTVDLEASIPQYAFYGCNNITAVKLPASITSVGDYAFYGCSSATEITLDNTGSIGKYAFYGCSSATEIALENAGSIGDYAFSGSATGEEAVLSISSTVTSVGANAFNGCSSIKTAEIRNDGNIGESAFYRCSGLSEIDVSNSGNIGQSAFAECVSLTKLHIGNAGSIGDHAFSGSATGEEAVLTIGSAVTSVGANAFNGCSGIKSAEIRNAGNIKDYAFKDCTSLENIVAENNGSIGSYAFSNCHSANSINLANTGSIGQYAFQNCSAAESLTIAPTVTAVGNYAFSGCTSIADVTIEDSDSKLSLGSNGSNPLFSDCPLDEVYIGRELSYQTGSGYGYSPFYRNTSLRSIEITDAETKIYDNEFYGCTNLQNVKIGDGVKSFGKYAFSGCSKIESFEFGKSVETIGEEAFSDCEGMTSMTSHNPVPPVCGTEALDDINKWECTLHVPTDALEAYMAADQWKNFFFINDDVSTEKYFDFEGLCFRVTDFDNLACEVVAPQEAPASVRMRAAAARERESVASIVIPATAGYGGSSYAVKGIADSAFSTFGQLGEVVIPEGVEYVGHDAFAGCSELHAVTVEALTPPTAYVDSFDSDTYSNAALSVPEESEMLYRTADCWKEFMDFTTHVRSAADGLTEIGRYNTDGQSVDPTYRGVVIIKYSDGSVRKMIAR